TMRLLSLPLAIFVFVYGTNLLLSETAGTRGTNSPESFYIVTHFFSDNLPDGYDEILQVAPQEKDVCVRVIRISLANPYCGGQLVRATERILPSTTVRKVAGSIDLCSHTEREVEAALKDASPKTLVSIWDTASQNIVAKCGTQEKVFEFPFPETVDLKALRRNNPRVRDLWDLSYKVRSRVFGEHFSFYELPAEEEKERESLGTKLLPELISGTFETGFDGYTCGDQGCGGNYLAWRLKGYTGAPANRDPSTVELINAADLHLAHYDLPRYPPLARMTRISGEVRLKIYPEEKTGAVKDVQLEQGNKLIGTAAVEAAKKWEFPAGTPAGQPVEAVLKFTLCAGENAP
ncbi:MAG: TonB family protein, partial [Candidatus Acidiferrum sp.]